MRCPTVRPISTICLAAVVLELIPLLTAFYVALRSGAAIVTEVAMMRVSGELDELMSAHIDPYEREFVPRIVAAAVSVFALTVVSCTVVMFVAKWSCQKRTSFSCNG